MSAYPEDQGTYTCKATNALGEAVTQANLTCICKISKLRANAFGMFPLFFVIL